MQSTTGLDRSLQDDSGLQLDGLNQESTQPAVDSFGNPRSQRSMDSSFESSPAYTPPAQSSGGSNKDMELILAKLDAIKAEITNISHRLELLETKNKPQPQSQNPNKRYMW